MSLHEIAALIDSRQETNSEYSFLVVYNSVDGFVCFVSISVSFYVHATQLESTLFTGRRKTALVLFEERT